MTAHPRVSNPLGHAQGVEVFQQADGVFARRVEAVAQVGGGHIALRIDDAEDGLDHLYIDSPTEDHIVVDLYEVAKFQQRIQHLFPNDLLRL